MKKWLGKIILQPGEAEQPGEVAAVAAPALAE